MRLHLMCGHCTLTFTSSCFSSRLHGQKAAGRQRRVGGRLLLVAATEWNHSEAWLWPRGIRVCSIRASTFGPSAFTVCLSFHEDLARGRMNWEGEAWTGRGKHDLEGEFGIVIKSVTSLSFCFQQLDEMVKEMMNQVNRQLSEHQLKSPPPEACKVELLATKRCVPVVPCMLWQHTNVQWLWRFLPFLFQGRSAAIHNSLSKPAKESWVGNTIYGNQAKTW